MMDERAQTFRANSNNDNIQIDVPGRFRNAIALSPLTLCKQTWKNWSLSIYVLEISITDMFFGSHLSCGVLRRRCSRESIVASNNGVASVTSHKECDIGVDRQAGVTAPLHIESYLEFANKYIHARHSAPLHLACISPASKIEIVFADSRRLRFSFTLEQKLIR